MTFETQQLFHTLNLELLYMYNVVGADFQNESYFHSFTYARAELPFNHLVIQLRGNYRVFQLILTDFEDLGGQLKTTFRL